MIYPLSMILVPEAKQRILARLLAGLAGAGFIALVPSVYLAWVEGLYFLAAADVAAYVCFVAVAFAPGVGYWAKLWTVVSVCHFLGVVVLFATGAQGAGYVWLIAGNLLSAVFGRARFTVASFVFSAAILVAYGIALAFGLDGHGYTPVLMVITGTNLFAVCLTIAAVIHAILMRMEESSAARDRLAEQLERELAESRLVRDRLANTLALKEAILQELNHRVSNNMQLILSLMDLDSGAGADDSVIKRHVRALSAANELILSREDESGAEFADLVRAVAETTVPWSEACMHPKSDGISHMFPPQQAIMAALCASDLLAHAAALEPESCSIDYGGGAARLILVFPEGTGPEAVAGVVRALAAGTMAAAAGASVRFGSLLGEEDRRPRIAATFASE